MFDKAIAESEHFNIYISADDDYTQFCNMTQIFVANIIINQ